MSGFIWSALGQGLANAGASAAGMMMKGIEEERQQSFKERLLELQVQKQKELASFASDLELAAIPKRISATAEAEAAAAPVRARGAVVGEAAGLAAANDANLPTLRAGATAASKAAEIKAVGDANIPELEAGLVRRQFDANKALNTEKAAQAATDQAAATVAGVNTPGYTDAVKKKAMADGAASLAAADKQIAASLTLASKPTIQSDNEGNIYLTSWDPKTKETTAKPLIGPDGKPMKGMKDLDQRTLTMVNALLTEAKGELDPSARQQTVRQVLELLNGGTLVPVPSSAIEALKKDPSLAPQFDAKYGPGASKKYLGK